MLYLQLILDVYCTSGFPPQIGSFLLRPFVFMVSPPIWGGKGSQATCSGLSETDGVHIQNELQIQHKELMSYNNRIAIFPVPSVPYMSIYMLTQ